MIYTDLPSILEIEVLTAYAILSPESQPPCLKGTHCLETSKLLRIL